MSRPPDPPNNLYPDPHDEEDDDVDGDDNDDDEEDDDEEDVYDVEDDDEAQDDDHDHEENDDDDNQEDVFGDPDDEDFQNLPLGFWNPHVPDAAQETYSKFEDFINKTGLSLKLDELTPGKLFYLNQLLNSSLPNLFFFIFDNVYLDQ